MVRVARQRDEWAAFGPPSMGIMEGQGSGVIVDKDGYVITNFHVVNGATQVTVTLSDGRPIRDVELVGDDPTSDLAVLKISASGLTEAPWGDSDRLEVGDQVLAVGSPYGLDQTVTAGIISAKERRGLPVPNSGLIYQDFVQTDAAVNPGNSGGPLVNLKGEVVGINTAIIGQGYQGISFAIPSNLAKSVYEKLKAGERIVRGWLGVRMQPLTERDARALGLEDTRGALVDGVVRDSPAEQAGIKPADVIVAWNGKPVRDANDLRFLIAGTAVETTVKVTVIREKEKLELPVTVGDRNSRRKQ
jgi:serine protease Do